MSSMLNEKERTQYREGTLAQFLEEYVELYGRVRWACSTYTSNEGLIRNHIIPFMGSIVNLICKQNEEVSGVAWQSAFAAGEAADNSNNQYVNKSYSMGR